MSVQLKFFKIDFIIFVYFYHVYVLLGFFFKSRVFFLYMLSLTFFFSHFRFMITYFLIFVRLKQSDRILSDVKLLVYCNISYHIDLFMITYVNK